MRVKVVPSAWLEQDGRRLDCGPYMSGALEAKVLLQALSARKDPLSTVTRGGMSGIFHAGRIRRTWVDSPDYGRPFLSSTEILQADLTHLPYISERAVTENPRLLISPNWILITRSGTVGRMGYSRGDMAGYACSEHVLRVVPDPEQIPPGYLYAYLSSKFGVPLVVGGTYGAIIQHIEPEHIADLPVPRFDAAFENKIHQLIENASALRVKATVTLQTVVARFDSLIATVASQAVVSPRVGAVPASSLQKRLDAQFHDPIVREIRERLEFGEHTTIRNWCNRVDLPGIFKRIYTDDASFGAPYYTGAALFWLDPQAKGILSRKTALFEQLLLDEGTVLVQAFGQDGGLTGRPLWVGRNLAGATTTHMLVRLRAPTLEQTAYLFGFLQSNSAYRQIASLTYGGSIPHFDEAGISSVVLPLFPPEERRELAQRVLSAVTARDDALDAEREASDLVEDAIRKGGA